MTSKKDEEINLYIAAIITRDPSKRQIKPVDKDAFQLFEDFESGSDEDFVLGSEEESDENDEAKDNDSDEPAEDQEPDVDSTDKCSEDDEEVITPKENGIDNQLCDIPVVTKCKLDTVMICMVCLLDVTYSDNEIIECDGCGVVVHEDCYKICDNVFMSCDNSDSSTDPWFCDACLNNVHDPRCELCPVEGGVFKRTENNCWVHLQCALYIPGVAFNDVESLTEITLSELPLKEWSARECCICTNSFYAKTGICISCDAGLCKNFFHVLCAQKEGLLSEPNLEENPDDPYFAQCLQHTDKETAKRRRKNWTAAVNRQRLRIEDWNKNSHFSDVRLQRKLEYFSTLYQKLCELTPSPFFSLNKVPCYLETNPVSVYLFRQKAINLRLPQDVLNSYTTSDFKTGTGVPVFSPDFITYFLDREKKIDEMSLEIVRLESSHRDMQISEQNTSHQFNKIMARKDAISQEYKTRLDRLHSIADILKHTSMLPDLTKMIKRILSRFPVRDDDNVSVQATENGDNNNNNNNSVNATLIANNNNNTINTNTINNGHKKRDSIINECCKCKSVGDQHLLIDCDDCSKYFHLSCLEPPLLRMPRKTKLYGWQCSNCGQVSSDESRQQKVDINCPRQLRKGTDVTSRYKRSYSMNATNHLLQTSKDIANRISKIRLSKKRIIKVRTTKLEKVDQNCEIQNTAATSPVSDKPRILNALHGSNVFIALSDLNMTNMTHMTQEPSVNSASTSELSNPPIAALIQRKSDRPRKRPMTLLDEFESPVIVKRPRHSKVIVRSQAMRKSIPNRKQRSLSSLKSVSSIKREHKLFQSFVVADEVDMTKHAHIQPITFYPSMDNRSSEPPGSDQVQIGVVAKKAVVGSREVGLVGLAGMATTKVVDKKPVLIKWHGDQDDAWSDKMADYGSSVSTEYSRRSN